MKQQPPTTRFSLIGRLHDETDSDAWRECVQMYHPMILRIAEKRGLQYADAVEVSQDVLNRVRGVIESWDPSPRKGSFRGWLFKITRNLTVDRLRQIQSRNQKSEQLDSKFDFDLVAEPTTDESHEFRLEYERQLFNWAAGVVQWSFKSENWQAFYSSTIDGLSVEETARELGMSKAQVYVARSRVMSRVSALIQTRIEDVAQG